MPTLYFQCELLSDIILNASSATAQSTDTLEYIPAAKFLGIVAKALYNKADNAKKQAIFHSGKVRFGDAHLVQKGIRSLHVPFDFMTAKKPKEEDKNKIWLNHFLTDAERSENSSTGRQLQQLRKGFFVSHENSISFLENTSRYSLKSAYNADERRTKNQQMFGYNAIQKGSLWQFSVDIDEDLDDYKKEIKDALIGEHGIGKSRSAQYGRVKITPIEKSKSFAKEHTIIDEKHTEHKNSIILYAESNCCFLDKYGEYTVKPDASDLNLAGATIDWHKSQIRHRVYAPWNIHRSTRDADRWIIEKGSVLHLKNVGISCEEVAAKLARGVGEFRTEGYGKFLVNPDFLCAQATLTIQKEDEPKPEIQKESVALTGKNRLIQKMLSCRKEKVTTAKSISSNLIKNISDYPNMFKSITASQWGQVRAYAQNIKDWPTLEKLLFDDKFGFLYTGKRKEVWTATAIKELELLKTANKLLVFASEMAKIAQQTAQQTTKEN